MKSFRHILFPVDFSDRCRSVRPFVQTLAERFQARLTLLHVVHIPAACYGGFEAGYPVIMDLPTMEQAAKQEMGTFFEEPHVPFDTVAKIGDPAFEIIRYTEANDVDLIMLPTHGYGTFRSLLLGSVVAKVLHDAHCPVWTAAHTEDPHLPDHLNFKNIMCAIELSKESPELICKAVELSAAFGARLRLVHAVPHAEPNPQLRFDDGFRASLLQHAREEIAEMQAGLGTDLEVCLESGSVADVVRDACLHHDAGLAIIGRGTLTQAFGRLRTNAYGIIRQSPCPVLSV